MSQIKGSFFFLLLFLVVLLSPVRADEAACGSSEDQSKKIDQLLQNQKEMIASLEELKSELNIVKIRVSSR